MLRPGELLGVERKDLATEPEQHKVLLSLDLTKGGKRAGAAESIVFVLKHWMNLAPTHQSVTPAPHKWRALFDKLKITSFAFRPYIVFVGVVRPIGSPSTIVLTNFC